MKNSASRTLLLRGLTQFFCVMMSLVQPCSAAEPELTASATIAFAEDPTRFEKFTSNSGPKAEACLGPYGGFQGALGSACASIENRAMRLKTSAHTEPRDRPDVDEGVHASGIVTVKEVLSVAAPPFALLFPWQQTMFEYRVHGKLAASGLNSRAGMNAEAQAVFVQPNRATLSPAAVGAGVRGGLGTSDTKEVNEKLSLLVNLERTLDFYTVELRVNLSGNAMADGHFEGPGDASLDASATMELTSISFFDPEGNLIPGYTVTGQSGLTYPINVATNWPGVPALSARLQGTNSIVLSWPAARGGLSLMESPSLQPATWRRVSRRPLLVEDQHEVEMMLSQGSRFFRLGLR